jgi:CheY-like chemotaxis protein
MNTTKPVDYNSHRKYTKQQTVDTHKKKEKKQPISYTKRILIIDDDPDVTLTFKKGLELQNSYNKTFFKVYVYNDPIEALTKFKPNFYDLLLVDINMSEMNGFEFSTKILELDLNVRLCFMSSGLINQEALREQYPSLSIGCFIRKPTSIEYLIKRVKAELE